MSLRPKKSVKRRTVAATESRPPDTDDDASMCWLTAWSFNVLLQSIRTLQWSDYGSQQQIHYIYCSTKRFIRTSDTVEKQEDPPIGWAGRNSILLTLPSTNKATVEYPAYWAASEWARLQIRNISQYNRTYDFSTFVCIFIQFAANRKQLVSNIWCSCSGNWSEYGYPCKICWFAVAPFMNSKRSLCDGGQRANEQTTEYGAPIAWP